MELAELRVSVLSPGHIVNHLTSVLRTWQHELYNNLSTSDASNRIISFLLDCDGRAGKLYLINYFTSRFPFKTQAWTVVGLGKGQDLAYDLTVNTCYIFFTVSRNSQIRFVE